MSGVTVHTMIASELAAVDAALLQRDFRRLDRHIGRRDFRRGDVALDNARPARESIGCWSPPSFPDPDSSAHRAARSSRAR